MPFGEDTSNCSRWDLQQATVSSLFVSSNRQTAVKTQSSLELHSSWIH